MDRREILVTRYGEMMDMLACLSVYEGSAEVKTRARHITNINDVIKLR